MFHSLQAERPDLAGIIISGSGIVDLGPEVAESGVRAFLQKPIDVEVLYNEIAAAFTGGSPDHTV